MHRSWRSVAIVIACLVSLPMVAPAQSRMLRVVSADSQPVIYAFVTIEGGAGQITDEKGQINLGKGKRKTVSVNVRRIGYQPFAGKIDLPDTAATLIVMLPRLQQSLGAVTVTATNGTQSALRLHGFYDRWLLRQNGMLSATFIGPEEIESRHPDKITNLLSGLNGVSFRRTERGDLVAVGYNGTCQMAVLVDGVVQCPSKGCKCDQCGANGVEIGNVRGSNSRGAPKGAETKDTLDESTAVLIDRIIEADNVTAIEVYARGGNVPASLPVADAACGAIALWTGSRKP